MLPNKPTSHWLESKAEEPPTDPGAPFCRILAYNAELDLARRLNTYLDDPDEYRAIARNLLHLGGTITCGRDTVTVHLDRPDAPRVAHAFDQLVKELNARPVVRFAGDRRPIISQVAGLG